ncbi:MAG: ABC transporter substrate-binding protein [Proteobacteria bacterium]|nr:ABC transporter substrate-binding protein [Pseudomonadota bacterium]
MRKKKTLFGCLIACLLLIAWAVQPASGLAEDKVLNYVEIGPLTGPGAGAVLPVAWGYTDYFKELNGKGGIDGVKINHIPVDSRYDVARGVSIYQRYRKMPHVILFFTHKSGLTKATLPLMERDHHITLASGAGFAQAHIGRAFLLTATYQDVFGAALDWMAEDWKKKGKSGPPVVGYLSWEGAYGKQALNGGTEYAAQKGIKLLPPEFYPTGSLKHDTWLSRLAEQGANYIYVGGVDPSQTNVIRDANALGLTEKIQMVSAEWGLISTVGVRAHPKEVEGAVLSTPQLRGVLAQEHPMAQLWAKYRKQPMEDMNPFYLSGIGGGMVIEAAVRIALKDTPWDKINGDVMMKALEQLTGQDVTKGIIGKCGYSPTSRVASQQVRLYQAKGGKIYPITDWVTAPDCVKLGKW